jgi:hypothetical protein
MPCGTADEERNNSQCLNESRRQKQPRGGAGGGRARVRRECGNESEHGRRKGIGALPTATISGTTRVRSCFENSAWAIIGGSDVVLPIPAPNKKTPNNRRGMVSPAANKKASEPKICMT